MANFTAGTFFSDGVTNDVNAAKLNALVADAVPTSNLALTSTSGTIATFNSTTGTITTGVIPTLTSTTLITTGTGTAASPAIVPTGDTNTGIFFPAADTLAATTNGTERLRINSSGQVGIGSTAPNAKLFVSVGTSPNTAQLLVGYLNGSDNYYDANTHYFRDGSSAEKMRIDSSGNVGIGTTSPTAIGSGATLDLRSTSGAGIGLGSTSAGQFAQMYVLNADSSLRIQNTSASGFTQFATNGTECMRIDSSGNVGIGATSPSSSIGLTKVLEIGGTYGGIAFSSTTPSSNKVEIGNFGSNTLVFATNGTESMRIDSGGNVYVGTTNSIGKFTVEASGSSTSNIPLTTNSITGAGNRFAAGFYYSGTKVGSIEVTASATSYVTSSDYRLKTNLEPISNGIERVKQLPVYRFNWIADEGGNKVDGFVAHEAKAIVPECVSGEKDAVDSDGKPIHQGIDQSKIVPLLTAALKEAIAKIETLESKVTALEAA